MSSGLNKTHSWAGLNRRPPVCRLGLTYCLQDVMGLSPHPPPLNKSSQLAVGWVTQEKANTKARGRNYLLSAYMSDLVLGVRDTI